MIKFISRIEALKFNEFVGSKILKIQEAKYSDFEDYDSIKDSVSFSEVQALEYQGNLKLVFNDVDINTFDVGMSMEFEKFMSDLGLNEVIFLLDRNDKWLKQINNYPQVLNSRLHLVSSGMNEHFSGGMVVDGKDISAVVKSTFWLIRGNMSLPTVYFTFRESKIFGTICKHGEVHLEFYSVSEKEQIISQLVNTNFELSDSLHCTNQFLDTDKIEGRELNL